MRKQTKDIWNETRIVDLSNRWTKNPPPTIINVPCNCASRRGPIAWLDEKIMRIALGVWALVKGFISYFTPSPVGNVSDMNISECCSACI